MKVNRVLISKRKYSNYHSHKCKLENGNIVYYDAANSSDDKNPNPEIFESLGFGEFYSCIMNGNEIKLSGTGYFYKKKDLK